MISKQTIDVIKTITPAVGAHAELITRQFYTRMFAENPEVQAYFNQAHQHSGGQQRALAGAICAYFTHIENPAVLGPAVELIAQKHCSLGVKPEHYPIVGKHLLAAIQDVMGDAADEQVLAAVGEAYQFLADVCIGREASIYDSQASTPGGWNGYRPFTVDRKERESDVVTSFYLKPTDGGPLASFLPGQYITLQIDHPTTPTSPRNYSLSDRPGTGHYRISVKREPRLVDDAPDGVISNYLHDHVNVGDVLNIGPPCGEFTLDLSTPEMSHNVFLAAGIGVTPLISMAKSLVHAKVKAPIHFYHASRNGLHHAFRKELQDLTQASDTFQYHVLYDQPLQEDLSSGACDPRRTRIDADLIATQTDPTTSTYYFCGPKPFMTNIYRALKRLGVDESRIRFEFFGPRQELDGD